jgi:hypothetical protein
LTYVVELDRIEGLGEHVRWVLFTADPYYFDVSILDVFAEEVMTDVDVLAAGVNF